MGFLTQRITRPTIHRGVPDTARLQGAHEKESHAPRFIVGFLTQPGYSFHFACQCRYRKPLFASAALQEAVAQQLQQVCTDTGYHLLEHRVEPVFLRALLSLRPEGSPSAVAKNIKGVLSRRLEQEHPEAFQTVTDGKLWSDSYFCGSVGAATRSVLEKYLGRQVDHHGYQNAELKRMRYKFGVPEWKGDANPVLIRYQIVMETERRVQLFAPEATDRLAPHLYDAVREIDCKLARASFLPDHVHLGVCAAPSVSPRDIALKLMNDSALWMLENYEGSLEFENAWNTWSPSAYVGTIGEVTTKHISNYLSLPL